MNMHSTLFDRLPQEHPLRYLALDVKARLTMSMAQYEKGARLFCQLLPYIEDRQKRLEIHYKHAHAWVLGGFGTEGIEAAQAGIAEVEGVPLEQLSRLEGNWLTALYNRMTEAYVNLEQYDLAVDYARKALDVLCERFYSRSFEDSLGWKKFHLARALMFAGQYAEAEQVIQHSITLFEKDNNPWASSYAYQILGQILTKKEKFDEALQLYERASQILQPFYGSEHVDIAVNLECRGNTFAAMGQTEKAQGYYQQAMDIYRKCNCHRRAEKVGKNSFV